MGAGVRAELTADHLLPALNAEFGALGKYLALGRPICLEVTALITTRTDRTGRVREVRSDRDACQLEAQPLEVDGAVASA